MNLGRATAGTFSNQEGGSNGRHTDRPPRRKTARRKTNSSNPSRPPHSHSRSGVVVFFFLSPFCCRPLVLIRCQPHCHCHLFPPGSATRQSSLLRADSCESQQPTNSLPVPFSETFQSSLSLPLWPSQPPPSPEPAFWANELFTSGVRHFEVTRTLSTWLASHSSRNTTDEKNKEPLSTKV